jgi:hypothetical protein
MPPGSSRRRHTPQACLCHADLDDLGAVTPTRPAVAAAQIFGDMREYKYWGAPPLLRSVIGDRYKIIAGHDI